jgi:hypothetical protein
MLITVDDIPVYQADDTRVFLLVAFPLFTSLYPSLPHLEQKSLCDLNRTQFNVGSKCVRAVITSEKRQLLLALWRQHREKNTVLWGAGKFALFESATYDPIQQNILLL